MLKSKKIIKLTISFVVLVVSMFGLFSGISKFITCFNSVIQGENDITVIIIPNNNGNININSHNTNGENNTQSLNTDTVSPDTGNFSVKSLMIQLALSVIGLITSAIGLITSLIELLIKYLKDGNKNE